MKERLTVDHLLILECLYNKDYVMLDKYDHNFSLERALNNYQNLERKELIVADDSENTYYIISVIGREFYEEILDLSMGNISSKSSIRLKRDELFEKWWSSYPATSDWESEDGRRFISGRSLRAGKKEDNRKLYYKILNEGRYTADEILECLLYEIEAKKKQSLSTNHNHLQYMQGSITYLNQRTFENFIDIIRSGKRINESTSNYDLE